MLVCGTIWQNQGQVTVGECGQARAGGECEWWWSILLLNIHERQCIRAQNAPLFNCLLRLKFTGNQDQKCEYSIIIIIIMHNKKMLGFLKMLLGLINVRSWCAEGGWRISESEELKGNWTEVITCSTSVERKTCHPAWKVQMRIRISLNHPLTDTVPESRDQRSNGSQTSKRTLGYFVYRDLTTAESGLTP